MTPSRNANLATAEHNFLIRSARSIDYIGLMWLVISRRIRWDGERYYVTDAYGVRIAAAPLAIELKSRGLIESPVWEDLRVKATPLGIESFYAARRRFGIDDISQLNPSVQTILKQ